jgi:hypothetical protein
MTTLQLVTQLRQLLLEQPQTADYEVVLVPHGNARSQGLAQIHQQRTVVLLEARG